tara:strand:- start:36 stop:557 length:522 start_codon:yes stop_codon:yes gene_type:complete
MVKQEVPDIFKISANKNPSDVVFTPDNISKDFVDRYDFYGKVLEPCKGMGAILKYLPKDSEWCEIAYGVDFYEYKNKVDWLITNPPYSDFDRFLDHAFEVADNVCLLVPFAKIFKSMGTMRKIYNYGGIVSAFVIGASKCGFPFGFPVGMIHIKKGYTGQTQIEVEQVDKKVR